jgi:hypothetical protein
MSKTINKKLNPTWDQMLVLESVPIYGHPKQIVENPPDVVMELFDRDRMVRIVLQRRNSSHRLWCIHLVNRII